MKSLSHPADPSLRSDFKHYILLNTVLLECSFCSKPFVAKAGDDEEKWCWSCMEAYRRIRAHLLRKKVWGLSKAVLLSSYGAGTRENLEAMVLNTGI